MATLLAQETFKPSTRSVSYIFDRLIIIITIMGDIFPSAFALLSRKFTLCQDVVRSRLMTNSSSTQLGEVRDKLKLIS